MSFYEHLKLPVVFLVLIFSEPKNFGHCLNMYLFMYVENKKFSRKVSYKIPLPSAILLSMSLITCETFHRTQIPGRELIFFPPHTLQLKSSSY